MAARKTAATKTAARKATARKTAAKKTAVRRSSTRSAVSAVVTAPPTMCFCSNAKCKQHLIPKDCTSLTEWPSSILCGECGKDCTYGKPPAVSV